MVFKDKFNIFKFLFQILLPFLIKHMQLVVVLVFLLDSQIFWDLFYLAKQHAFDRVYSFLN